MRRNGAEAFAPKYKTDGLPNVLANAKPATMANGTLRVIPRMFDQALNHERDPDSDHHIRCWGDESYAVSVELPARGVVFFAYGTSHSTGLNLTDTERAGKRFTLSMESSRPQRKVGLRLIADRG